MKLRCLNEQSDCHDCQPPSHEVHQNCPVLIRDLPVFGQSVHLQVPRRQFDCGHCQRYFTERRTCQQILKLEAALWTFVEHPNINTPDSFWDGS